MTDSRAPRRSPVERRQRLLLWAAIAAAVLSTAGLLLSLTIRSPAQQAADQAAPPPTTLTEAVARRVLIGTVTVRGTVAAASTIRVLPAVFTAGGAAIVTALPKAVGAAVQAGDVLAQVSGRPVLALPGATPAYRDLKPGAEGADVEQLQNALVALGHLAADDVDGHFGGATKDAVAALYSDRGFDALTTADANEGEAAELSGAQQAVVAAQQQRASAALEFAQAVDDVAQAQARLAVEFATRAEADAEDALAALRARTGVEMPLAETVFVPSFPVTVGSLDLPVGAPLSGATGALLTLDVGDPIVSAVVPAGREQQLAAGQKVTVVDDVDRREAEGTVTALGDYSGGGTAEGAAEGTESAPGFPLTVTPAPALPADWRGRNVRVTVTVGETPAPVLVVPVVAVQSADDGTTFVTVLQSEGGQRVAVPVSTGLIAEGEVEVTPAEGAVLEEGARVVVG
ncbi:peptidoglycan-binding domain-containing protein [Rathayibacter sp. PhB185]|uniref:peptidoglycan-binding domain-containing protein n=1 Tax=Rathayibacter sp. PhB185 TaxID=2485198 RepID=UPI000FBE6CE8|nr:peptidoglycan-binding domain-containing protein [Rathayibacter sp. PhB185]ROP48691.1 putative peptidoglycan binding protein [Rathayibacter sp. PhB186]ROS49840.1 putative peptidoglycan binding protein [Rathayibacter sp. PhB185]